MIPVPPASAGLPDLDILFDGDAMADVLRRSLPDCVSGAFTVDACRPVYIRYKPDTSCLVQHEITLRDLDSGAILETIAHTRQYIDDRAAIEFQRGRLRRLLERAREEHPDPPIERAAYVPHLRALVQLFPVDVKLRPLVRATSAARMGSVLRKALPDAAASLTSCQPELIRYKPARKALLRYALHGAEAATVYAKIYAEEESAAKFAVGQALVAAGVPTPPVLAHISKLRMVVQSTAPAASLVDLRGSPAFKEWLEPVGMALADLHATEVAALPIWTVADEATALRAAGTAAQTLLPGSAVDVEQLTATLVSSLAALPACQLTTHGDFYDDQVVVSDAGLSLIDFDEARLSHPLHDVGNFLAHLTVRLDPTVAEEARAALLDAYAARHPTAREHASLFEAAALLKLAVGPFRRLEPDWPATVERHLQQAETALQQHTGGVRPRQVVGADRRVCPLPNHDAGIRSTWTRGRGQTRRSAPTPNGCHNDPLSISDPTLPQLATLCDPTIMTAELAGVLNAGPMTVDQIAVIRHKPGRRAILRYDLQAQAPANRQSMRLYGKTFASERGPRVHAIMETIATARACGEGVSLPEPVAYLPHLKLLVQRSVPGEPARPALLDGDVALARLIAESLHRLHAAEIGLGRRHDIERELAPLRARVERLSAACPPLADHARVCLDHVEQARQDWRWDWRWRSIHRDFYHDQVLVHGDGLSILDFDDAAMSEPAIDVANFAAHLRLLALQAFDDPRRLASVRSAFVDRSRQLDPALNPDLLRFLEGAALLRLAEIHLTHDHGQLIARGLLAESKRLLDAGSGARRLMNIGEPLRYRVQRV